MLIPTNNSDHEHPNHFLSELKLNVVVYLIVTIVSYNIAGDWCG